MRIFYRFEKARSAFHGHDIADVFSGYGPYGRPTRVHAGRLRMLLEGTGFAVARFDVVDLDPGGHPADGAHIRVVSEVFGVPPSSRCGGAGSK